MTGLGRGLGRWRSGALSLVLVFGLALGPSGCSCGGECASKVDFSFPEVIRGLPRGSVPTACVETTCQPVAPDQENAAVFLGDGEDDDSEVTAKLTVRNRTGDVVFEREAPLKLKSHKAGRACPVACRTGSIVFRP